MVMSRAFERLTNRKYVSERDVSGGGGCGGDDDDDDDDDDNDDVDKSYVILRTA